MHCSDGRSFASLGPVSRTRPVIIHMPHDAHLAHPHPSLSMLYIVGAVDSIIPRDRGSLRPYARTHAHAQGRPPHTHIRTRVPDTHARARTHTHVHTHTHGCAGTSVPAVSSVTTAAARRRAACGRSLGWRPGPTAPGASAPPSSCGAPAGLPRARGPRRRGCETRWIEGMRGYVPGLYGTQAYPGLAGALCRFNGRGPLQWSRAASMVSMGLRLTI